MTDIINRIDEAIDKSKLMRHIKWDEMMYNFFGAFDFFKNSDADSNINIKNGQKIADKAMMNLSNFFDSIPMIDKYKQQWEKEQKKLRKMK